MSDESTMKLTDFDYLIGDHHLQMVKAAIPYVNVTGQRFLSFFVKLRELQRTVSLFQEEQVNAMGICPPTNGQKGSLLEIMKAIRPYGNTQEQDMIDILCNFLSGPRMSGQYPDIISAQAPDPSTTDDLPPTEIVPAHDTTAASHPGINPPLSEFSSFRKAFASPGSETETGSAPAQLSNSRSIPASVEQLKNFLPPDQQARIEQAAFILQALQQFT